ncbi:MAG TPA: phosphoribosyl-AMP cyclohydrolase [Phycisphaerae bacterium]|jgi:phosphoribosyl-AMP cyclohydrolase|nr:phosphoribosyl-AMP cyclohydrolase [Phycisphaerae bacterium]HOB74478.1 phosphoribosyl-AMP cyclohydrolase [Phycisphaerae bacterium]HOJ54306.1 phosphoribosyl-AMP cyclohydrolase [Phycisphaerae bacterium]HOL26777.1 phosphoribosyl-AMP cyclohydrolase [Phycisphaerae bacterium]HPP20663.1 phosphoribosyl-AMP cyclohydrolase [Phycisphaerae bacterium]
MQGLEQIDWAKGDGLVPAIVQDADTGEVLMMAYMNKESLADSIRTGKTHFWSRSRQKYWMKGESSGHVQEITAIYVDCDADTILIKARQHGAACHEGYKNCFFRKLNAAGEWETCAQRLVDPEQVYGKKK